MVGPAELLTNGRRLRAAGGGGARASSFLRFAHRGGVGRARSARSGCVSFSAAQARTASWSFQGAGSPTQSQTLMSCTAPEQAGGSGEGGSLRKSPARRGGRAAILRSLGGSSSSAPSVPLRTVLPQGAVTGQRVLGRAGSGNAPGAVTGPSEAPLSSPPVISPLGSMQREGKALGVQLSERVCGRKFSPDLGQPQSAPFPPPLAPRRVHPGP